MSIIPNFPRERPEGCPQGAHDCTCRCHLLPGVKHVVPCCYPCHTCGYDIRGENCKCGDPEDDVVVENTDGN